MSNRHNHTHRQLDDEQHDLNAGDGRSHDHRLALTGKVTDFLADPAHRHLLSAQPLNLESLCAHVKVHACSYSTANPELIAISTAGFTVCEQGECYLFYNTSQPFDQIQLSLATQLCHYLLCHPLSHPHFFQVAHVLEQQSEQHPAQHPDQQSDQYPDQQSKQYPKNAAFQPLADDAAYFARHLINFHRQPCVEKCSSALSSQLDSF
ncbi:hypothetical protein [Anoxynatronum buryatiense]|uniref:Uncharacterized protein n=1 Tax=Anoxynatronum buryatiense TaxID=489973 RepID=A0AA45WSK2_9CLOT|nr:hypothetical protein [Anoxynatronum buryatiense]SMP38380.1 hypothetical protein SAMN06296020_10189 [Anoxynatronum buryatiense]